MEISYKMNNKPKCLFTKGKVTISNNVLIFTHFFAFISRLSPSLTSTSLLYDPN